MPERQLHDRVVLVTGAGSGIGRAVAGLFLSEGARVVAFDRSPGSLSELSGLYPDAVVSVVGDVRDPGAHDEAVAAAIDCFGGLDVLVGNAGVFDGSVALEDMDAPTLRAGFAEILEVNVLGYLLAARAAAPQLRERRGSMVFTVSNAGFHAGSGGGVIYTASKHAVVGVVRQLAHEMAPDVRVNGVAPGGTITGLRVADALAGLAGRTLQFGDRADSESRLEAVTPLRLAAEPEDHAALYLLLAGDRAPAVTGEVIASDGGLGVRGLTYERRGEDGGGNA
ncbi:MAG: SDR family oxidoreductase [Actinobacteria bacterium]|nr:SDR family oxidoreductase [Actinomycetota bacterium]